MLRVTAFLLCCMPSCVYSVDLYLAPSKVPGAGQGVFTAAAIKKGDILDKSFSVLMDDYLSQEINLINYVYQSPFDFYAAMLFGSAVLINHKSHKNSNVEREWLEDSLVPSMPSNGLRPYTIFPSMSFRSKRDIQAGEELFVTYAEEEYFKERRTTATYGAPESAEDKYSEKYTAEELRLIGRSLSNINVSLSTISMAGKGAFATAAVVVGAAITVSPVLAVPKHLFMEWGRECVVINYCLSIENSDVAFLPLSYAALINHGGIRSSNVAIRWFDWKGRSADEIFADVSPDGLTGFGGSPLYIEYYATRPISPGDELLLDYGSAWETAWKQYLESMSAWLSTHGAGGVSLLYAPQFRHPISFPKDIYPASLIVGCVGTSDCALPNKKRRPDMVNERMKKSGHHFNVDINAVRKAQDHLLATFDINRKGKAEVNVNGDTNGPVDVSKLQCGMYLAPVVGTAGMLNKQTTGVFAGVPIAKKTPIEGSVNTLLKKELQKKGNILSQYTAASTRLNYNIVYFGFGAHMRESVRPNVGRSVMAKNQEDIPLPNIQASRPYTTNENVVHFTEIKVSPGSELLLMAEGKTNAQKFRDAVKLMHPDSEPMVYNMSELRAIGHCLTHIYVEPSKIPMANKGVFTESTYKSGDRVSISQALILPKHLLFEEETSVLINYCISATQTDVALLPLGQAALINHGGIRSSNVAIRWFDWKGRSADEIFADVSPDGLTGFGGSPLYIEYYATRPISPGDELLLDYGSAWETAWKQYLESMSVWLSTHGAGGVSLLYAPQFRHPISSPSGLFPSFFSKKRCFGSPFCSAKGLMKTAVNLSDKLNLENATMLNLGNDFVFKRKSKYKNTRSLSSIIDKDTFEIETIDKSHIFPIKEEEKDAVNEDGGLIGVLSKLLKNLFM